MQIVPAKMLETLKEGWVRLDDSESYRNAYGNDIPKSV